MRTQRARRPRLSRTSVSQLQAKQTSAESNKARRLSGERREDAHASSSLSCSGPARDFARNRKWWPVSFLRFFTMYVC
eukprot:2810465-Rhodomonas_salina.2